MTPEELDAVSALIPHSGPGILYSTRKLAIKARVMRQLFSDRQAAANTEYFLATVGTEFEGIRVMYKGALYPDPAVIPNLDSNSAQYIEEDHEIAPYLDRLVQVQNDSKLVDGYLTCILRKCNFAGDFEYFTGDTDKIPELAATYNVPTEYYETLREEFKEYAIFLQVMKMLPSIMG